MIANANWKCKIKEDNEDPKDSKSKLASTVGFQRYLINNEFFNKTKIKILLLRIKFWNFKC